MLPELGWTRAIIKRDGLPIREVQRQAQRLKKRGLIEIKVYHQVYRGNHGEEGGGTMNTFAGYLMEEGTVVQEKALKDYSKSHGTR